MSLTQFIMVHTVRILILLQIPQTTTQTQMIMTMYSCWALKEQIICDSLQPYHPNGLQHPRYLDMQEKAAGKLRSRLMKIH